MTRRVVAGRTWGLASELVLTTNHNVQGATVMPDHQRPAGSPHVELRLVKQITDAFVNALDIPAETVQVCIHEVPTDSCGVAGRLAADT